MRSTADSSPVLEVAASLAAQRVGMVGLSPRLEKRISHILFAIGALAKPLDLPPPGTVHSARWP